MNSNAASLTDAAQPNELSTNRLLAGAVALAPLVLFAVLAATAFTPGWEWIVMPAVVGAQSLTGWLIVTRGRGNLIGWLLLASSLLLAVSFVPDIYLEFSVSEHGGALAGSALAAYASNALWPCWFAGVTAIAWVFPDGRLIGPRWRPLAALVVASYLLVMALGLFSHDELEGIYAGYVNPLPELPGALGWLQLLAFFGILASLIAAVAAVRIRVKSARGERRLQLLWFLWASLSIPAALALCLAEIALTGGEGGVVTLTAVVVMVTLIPAAIAVSLLRYRLFDIELVISRTLVYGALLILMAGVYAGIVAGATALIGSTTVAGVLGAGVVAVIVQPLHARLQRRVERYVYGDRSDPYAALQKLDARLRETQTPAEAVHTVVESVAESLRLPYAAVEFEREGEIQTIAVFGVRGRGRLEPRELWHRGESVGELVVEVPPGRPLAPADDALLDQLASHVGAAVQSVRLTVELQESRKDIVTAREEERRRLRRDLHDGVGPSLAAMSLQLDVLKDNVKSQDAELVDRLSGQVQDAIADIRRLVYELRPPALDQYGLVSVLSEQATLMSSGSANFEVVAPDELPPLPAAVEVAAYRIALEGMTNAARHSGSTRCEVTLSVGEDLTIVVDDDGVGIDERTAHGVGLRSMRERTAELGGRFAIGPSARAGTVLTATLPLGSA